MKIGLTIIICLTAIAGLRADGPCRMVGDDLEFKYKCKESDKDIDFLANCTKYSEDITLVRMSSCSSITLPIVAFGTENKVKSFRMENVSQKLQLDMFFYVGHMTSFELVNIRKIPKIKYASFTGVNEMDKFLIENTEIQIFEPIFEDMKVRELTLINVTIEGLEDLKITNGLLNVTIINSRITVTKERVHLETSNHGSIKIINSTFKTNNSECPNLTMKGGSVEVLNSVFFNTSVKDIGDICDGKNSSRRLGYNKTEDDRNKNPGDIDYQANNVKYVIIRNVICNGTDCECLRVRQEEVTPVTEKPKITSGAAARINYTVFLCLIAVSSIFITRI